MQGRQGQDAARDFQSFVDHRKNLAGSFEPYMTGQCIMTTDRLRAFLGSEYEAVMGHSVVEAFGESLAGVVLGVVETQSVAG